MWLRALASDSGTATYDHSSWVPHTVVINIGQNDYNNRKSGLTQEIRERFASFLGEIQAAYSTAVQILVLCSTMWAADEHCPLMAEVVTTFNQPSIRFLDMRLPGVTLTGCKDHPGDREMEMMKDLGE